MNNSNVFKVAGGISAIISGLLFVIAHTISYFAETAMAEVTGEFVVFLAHIGIVFAFIGLCSERPDRNGWLGQSGMVLGILGTILISSIVYVEIASASGADVQPVFQSTVPGLIQSVGPLLFVAGTILFGASILRKGKPYVAGGWLLIAGTVVFSIGSFAGDAELLLYQFGSALTGAGLIAMGFPLLRGKVRS